MKSLTRNILVTFVGALMIAPLAQAKDGKMEGLLNKIKNSRSAMSGELRQREQKFVSEKNQQAALLAQAKKQLRSLEARSESLSSQFETNEKELLKIEEEQRIAAGNLGEVFGVVRQVAGDLNSQLTNSIISSQYQERTKIIAPLAAAKSLPNIKQLESLWFELQREMIESGKVVKYNTDVVDSSGVKSAKEVVRVGAFNLISDSKFLTWLPETKQVAELLRQPSGTFTSTIDDLFSASAGTTTFALDPSRGAILSLLVQKPSLIEKVGQGGICLLYTSDAADE